MPTFEGVELTISTDVDFEVFCRTCGEDLSSESDTRKSRNSRNRGFAQVEVYPCPSCMKAKEDEIEKLKDEITYLQRQLEEEH